MKIRSIKPSFFTDEKLARVPIMARFLFIGTWLMADDNGVLRGNASFIKSQIFPYDESLRVGEVSKWLDALVEARMLEPFSYRGESFYRVRTFRAHQKIDARYPNTLIPSKEIISIFTPDGATPSPHRVPDGATALEVEYNSHTQEECSNNPSKNSTRTARTREEDEFEVLTGKWMQGFAPNLQYFASQLTLKQYSILRKSYFLADIARLMFAISAKVDVARLTDTASVYAAICTYAGNDHRIREQREAIAHNASLTAEGVARGNVAKKPVPRTTRISNPELGYIFDYE
uniref:hypothetical protein n=1 Tax=Alistipes sp. TaxID=1872444 RepID=UPI004056C5B8